MLSALETAACVVVAFSGDRWESQSWVLVLEESRRVSVKYKVVLIVLMCIGVSRGMK